MQGASELLAGASVLDKPAEEFVNNENIEQLWAMKAFEHAEVYFNLLSAIDPKLLRLSKIDDQLYQTFREQFRQLEIGTLKEDDIKSPKAKEEWRNFCESFKEIVDDYNTGTLIRLDSTKEYDQDNTIVVVRVQFLAIELARNREGYNDSIRKNFKPKKLKALS